ncbi:hypothetical protein [Nocardia asiatica]|uniref:hypothetical protein n=1 Tax=Nocardia asiatica TaxID=209252 RepID=UPI003CC809F7
MASAIGVSRATAQRYLAALVAGGAAPHHRGAPAAPRAATRGGLGGPPGFRGRRRLGRSLGFAGGRWRTAEQRVRQLPLGFRRHLTEQFVRDRSDRLFRGHPVLPSPLRSTHPDASRAVRCSGRDC